MDVGYPEAKNIVWQSRESVELMGFEFALAESLEAVFAGGVSDLDGGVEQFSGMDFPNREGKTWTPDGFESESKWLGR